MTNHHAVHRLAPIKREDVAQSWLAVVGHEVREGDHERIVALRDRERRAPAAPNVADLEGDITRGGNGHTSDRAVHADPRAAKRRVRLRRRACGFDERRKATEGDEERAKRTA